MWVSPRRHAGITPRWRPVDIPVRRARAPPNESIVSNEPHDNPFEQSVIPSSGRHTCSCIMYSRLASALWCAVYVPIHNFANLLLRGHDSHLASPLRSALTLARTQHDPRHAKIVTKIRPPGPPRAACRPAACRGLSPHPNRARPQSHTSNQGLGRGRSHSCRACSR